MADMLNLPDRLRARAEVSNKASRFGEGADLEMAAAEIERLRAALENAEQHLDCAISGTSSREMIVNDARHTLNHVREALGSAPEQRASQK